METYQQMQEHHQQTINGLPFIFAFSDRQLEEALAKRGMTTSDLEREPLVPLGGGCYCLKSELPRINDTMAAMQAELDTAMNDYDFAYGAFLYELGNHEYHINTYQGDWDVFRCFGYVEWGGEEAGANHYMDELGYTPDQKRAFYNARKDFLRQCDEKGWY